VIGRAFRILSGSALCTETAMTRLRVATVLLLASAFLGGCATPRAEPGRGTRLDALNAAIGRGADADSVAGTVGDYVLAPPDVIAIQVRGDATLDTPGVAIGPDGRIHRPLVGGIDVGGRTVADVRADLERRYERFIRGVEVSVSVVEHRSKHVYVTGEVRRPGRYAYTGGDHVLGILAQAGFLTRNAQSDGVRVARGRPGYTELLPVELDAIVERGDTRTNWRLEPDDVIHVPPGLLARVSYALQDVLAPFAVPVRVHSDD